MTDIVDQAQRVAGLIAQISAATAEQTEGIAQVGSVVTQLDSATQQNAALVEQSAAAAEALQQQAAQLATAVSVFTLDGDGQARMPARTQASQLQPRAATARPLPAAAKPLPAAGTPQPRPPALRIAPAKRPKAPRSTQESHDAEWESF